MNAPTADRLVRDARIGPRDTPHEAATHLWAQVVANHEVDPADPLVRLDVLDRVVLVWWTRLSLGAVLAIVAAIVTAGAAVGALVGPVPQPPLPEPVVVDADPQLPSDEEPATGWPTQPPTDDTSTVEQGEATTAEDDQDAASAEGTSDGTDNVAETTDDVADTIDETIDDATDVAEDVADTVDETANDTVDDVADTVDGASEGLEETTDGLP